MKFLVTVCSLLAICFGQQNQQVIIPRQINQLQQPRLSTLEQYTRPIYTHEQCAGLFYRCKNHCYEYCINSEDQSRYFDETLGRHDQHSYCKDHCAESCFYFGHHPNTQIQCQRFLMEEYNKDHEQDARRYASKKSETRNLNIPAHPYAPILANLSGNRTKSNYR